MLSLVPVRRNGLLRQRENDWNSFYNLFDDFFNEFPLKNAAAVQSSFKLDVRENEEAYIVEAELAGVKKENISLDYQEGYLSISVKQEDVVNEEKNDYIYRERRVNSMERSLHLKDVEVDQIQASLEEGILRIKLPKQTLRSNKTTIEIK